MADIDKDKLNDALFMQLTMSLQATAWAMLGKVASPFTGGIEKNMDGAKATIDTLAMLQEKTCGNLSKTEQAYLDNAVHQLRVNYIEEAQKEESPKKDAAKEEISTEQQDEEIREDEETDLIPTDETEDDPASEKSESDEDIEDKKGE